MFFFEKHSTDADAHHKHTRALISINTRTQSYLYEHLRETEPANIILEIDKITTGAPLSTQTSPTTESTNTLLNPRKFAPTGSRSQDLMCY